MGDYEALSKGLKRNFGRKIHDKQSFLVSMRKYMGSENSDLEEKVLESYQENYGILQGRLAISEEFVGDTKRRKAKKDISFKLVGKQKSRVVFAREIRIKTKYGFQKRFIDKRGRYVSVKSAKYKED